MSSKLQKDGIPFILGMIAGSGLKINGMYVEYGQPDQIHSGERNLTYFDQIKSDRKAGYARIGISHAEVSQGGVKFTSLLCPSDLNDGKVNKGVYICCVTLVCIKDSNPANDVFIYTADIESSPVVNGASMTITVGMKLTGD